MQSRTDDVKALRDILKLAKLTFCDKGLEITNENGWIYDDALSAFSMTGKEKIYELASDVYQFLKCDDEVLRKKAVTTLGLSTRLHLPEFKEVAYKIWLEDKDDGVRDAALRAWSSYYHNTQDRIVLKILYKILTNEKYSVASRHSALVEIFHTSQEPSDNYKRYNKKDFFMIRSNEEFNQKVDWNEIRSIMKKYAPDALL